MNKLRPFRAQFVTETYFPKLISAPDEINFGICFQWAWLAYQTFQDVQLWDCQRHAFVRYHGKFYDSEALTGASDWHKLRACNSDLHLSWTARRESETSFKEIWYEACDYHSLSWSELNRKAKRIVLRQGTK